MNKILLLILFLLMIYIDKKRGIKLFISLIINFLILLVLFYFISFGLNPIICSLIACFIISYIILYFVNGENIKTESSLKSIFIIGHSRPFIVTVSIMLLKIKVTFGIIKSGSVLIFDSTMRFDEPNLSFIAVPA